MVLDTEDTNAMNVQDAEDLNTPVTITKGELAQLSLAFNSCQAMAEQVQSLATEIAQLRSTFAHRTSYHGHSSP